MTERKKRTDQVFEDDERVDGVVDGGIEEKIVTRVQSAEGGVEKRGESGKGWYFEDIFYFWKRLF